MPYATARASLSRPWRRARRSLTALAVVLAGGFLARSVVAEETPGEPAPTHPDAARYQITDHIVAVVEDELVTASEVTEQLQLLMVELEVDERNQEEIERLRADVLKQLVDNLLIVKEAERRDIVIPDERIDFYVEQQLEQQKERLGGEEAFTKQLRAEGVTERQMREFYADDVRRQLLATRLVSLELEQDMEITDDEARAYFEAHQGELPKKPDQIRLRHLLIQPKPAADREIAAKQALEEALSRIRSGEDFAEVAKEVSLDPSASRGGDIGFFGRADLDPTFTDAAFALADSEVSDVVRSSYGYHIIQRLETRGEQIHARHIVRPHRVTPEDIERAKALVATVQRRIEEGADFVELVRAYSDAAEKDGDVGYFPVDGLFDQIRDAVTDLEIGEISSVVQDEQGYHFFQVIDRRAAAAYEYEEVVEQIRELVKRQRLTEQYESWIQELRERSYVDLRTG